jgi:penicillin-binding protein 2
LIGASGQNDQIQRNERTWGMILLLVLCFLGLLARVGWLQIVQGDVFLRESEANRLREDPVQAPRGLLLDREGRPLVQNRPSRNFVIDPATVRGREKELSAFLSRFEDVDGTPLFDTTFLHRLFRQARQTPSQRPVLLEDASPAEIALFSENQYRLPGILQEVAMRREYSYGSLAGHLLGYIGEIPEDLLDSLEGSGYRLGDLIGQMGLEQQYEKELKGRDGIRWIEVDAKGRIVGTPEGMPRTEPVPGLHVRTTIDLDLQKAAERALPDSMSGAVVALDPRSGEILAMCSSPRIDPNIFTLPGRRRAREWAKLALDPRMPLNNRAIQGTYEPGSTFKIVTSLAGLISGKFGPHQHFPVACHGGFRFGARIQHCWQMNAPFHGSLDMIQALTQSCDVYYYQLGLLLDMPWINKVGSSLGLGSRTGVDLPNEKTGLLVDSAVHEARNKLLGWKWARGLILNLAIGQGELVTPLQLATMTGGVANGHEVMKPHLMQAILESDNGKVVRRYEPETLSVLNWSDETIGVIHAAMDSVVNGARGTGHSARLPGIEVGGKSGSAENPHGRTHAVFVCAAPMNAPEIAIGVIVENGGHGGSTAGPIAAAIMRTYFRKTGRLPKDSLGTNPVMRRMDLTPSNDR